ncbi:MAG: AraC family transcriptional regulator ligand-binding domain-containing protein [Beijerinckiaceae bacterium]
MRGSPKFDCFTRADMYLHDPYIRATSLMGFIEVIGGDTPLALSLLAEAGIPGNALRNIDILVSYRRFTTLMEIAAHRLDRPSFGLEWALGLPPHFPNLGPIAMLSYFAKNGADWIALAQRYWHFHSNAFTMNLLDHDERHVALRYSGDFYAFPARQVIEHTLACACLVARKVTGFVNERPACVNFRHAKPADVTFHDQAFDCEINYNADYDEIILDRKYLEYPTNLNLSLFRPLLDLYVNERFRRMNTPELSISNMVRLAIPSLLGTGRCSLETISTSLGMSTKKLQRLLADEETTFTIVLEEVRQNLARRLLIESDAPVERIAGLLDYSAPTPFIQAFKRWAGETPLAYRKRQREALYKDNPKAE